MKRVFGFVMLLVFLFAAAVSAEFFRYVDKDGNIHYTDDYSQVPEDQRSDVRKYDVSTTDTDTVPEAAEKEEEPVTTQETRDNIQGDDRKQIEISNTEKRELDTRRQELDAEYAALMEEKEELEIMRKNAKPGAETQEYIKKAKAFNQKYWDYELKRRAFNQDIEKFKTKLLEGPGQ